MSKEGRSNPELRAVALLAATLSFTLLPGLVCRAEPAQPEAVAAKAPVASTNGTKPVQVELKSWFVEIRMRDGETNSDPANTNAPAITGILTAAQFQQTLEALQRRDGTDVLRAPLVWATSGFQAELSTIDIQQTVTSPGLVFGKTGASANGNVTMTPAFAPGTLTLSAGPKLDVIPKVSADGKSIQLELIPITLDFVGYDQAGQAGVGDFAPLGAVPSPAVPPSPPTGSPTAPQTSAPVTGGVTSVLPLPHFRLRQVVVNVTALNGQTVVISGLTTDVPVPDTKPLQTVRKKLVIFVTATLINPDGTPFHSDEEK